MKSTPKKIIAAATTFFEQLRSDDTGRYRSWEHCYSKFCEARKNNKPNIDYLSLHLAFYLASWGMYRGSSFLLRKDYRVHMPVVKEILKNKYDVLSGIECGMYHYEENLDLLMDLTNKIRDYYEPIREGVLKKDSTIPQKNISDTLVTKILMGTLACTPAFDRYFNSGVKNEKVCTASFSKDNIIKLVTFYEDNEELFESVRSGMRVGTRKYPQMKMLDMGFWKVGYDLDITKGTRWKNR